MRPMSQPRPPAPGGAEHRTKVLVVDDDPQILRALRINLAAHGYHVTLAADGASALRAAGSTNPDVVVLDLGLPDQDGLDVLAGLRGWTAVPVIVLSARTDSSDKVSALDAGADDYVTKPFGLAEFLARLRAAVRRAATEAGDGQAVVEFGDITVDLLAKRVMRGSAEVHLTPTEWGILEMLIRHRGKLVPQRELLRHVWGPYYDDRTNYLRVYLGQLRRKLEENPARPRHLITEPGMGYRLDT
jgi:two-component system KDP operon response regulator KdpE